MIELEIYKKFTEEIFIMKKLKLILGMALVSVLFWTAPALSAPTVVLDGRQISFDVPPTVENGRTLVPMRAIFEAMGATVSWNQQTLTATAIKSDTTVIIQLGSTTPTINGEAKMLDVSAKIVNGRMLVPLRFVGEAFGDAVNWDEVTQTINIDSTNEPEVTMPGAQNSVVDISSGLEFIYYDDSHSMDTFVVRDKLPETLQDFVYIGVLSGINKADTAADVLKDFYADTDGIYTYNEKYNTAGFGSAMVNFNTGNSAVFLFDKNNKLIGYHLVKEEELSIHKSPFVDIKILVEPCSIDILRPLDFKISKLINGEVDPEFTWNGGYSEGDGNEVILKYFLSGDNVTYKVEPAKEEVKIKSVQIVPTKW